MNNNIIFSFEETEPINKNNYESVQQMMTQFEEEDLDLLNLNLFNMHQEIDNISEFKDYNDYTVKELLKICNYYEIDNNIKTAKCKKLDIISTIQYYESLPENIEIVQKRKTMWFYIEELLNDPKMKKYVILF